VKDNFVAAKSASPNWVKDLRFFKDLKVENFNIDTSNMQNSKA